MKKGEVDRVADFLYEIGTLRKVARAHRQTLLTDDLSDNISSHSFRVAMIGLLLARLEKADPYKVVVMCLLHDIGEARSGDQNWVHKKYVKVFEEEITKNQLSKLPSESEWMTVVSEYNGRKSLESNIAKDADLIDQTLLLKEYEWRGNKEAALWLKNSRQIKMLKTKSGKKVGKVIWRRRPSEWWDNVWTSDRR